MVCKAWYAEATRHQGVVCPDPVRLGQDYERIAALIRHVDLDSCAQLW
jgi:hypothetical protein